MELRSNDWSDLTRTEISRARDAGALVVIPIGATEQHSDHLPTGTDSLAARRISLLSAAACDHPVLVAPTISVAFSAHHSSWPGTLTLKLSTLSALIEDITASIEGAGFTRQLLVNGHGGNRGPLTAITSELVTSGREVGYVDYFAPSKAEIAEIQKGNVKTVTHSGEMETALVMALEQGDPDKLAFYRSRVTDLAPRSMQAPYWRSDTPNPITAAGAFWPTLYLGDDPGYRGDPGIASVETGDRLIEAMVEKLSTFFADFAGADLRAGISPPVYTRDD